MDFQKHLDEIKKVNHYFPYFTLSRRSYSQLKGLLPKRILDEERPVVGSDVSHCLLKPPCVI